MDSPEADYIDEVISVLVPEVTAFLRRYVILPSEDHYLVVAVWILHTWLFEAAHTTPYLYVHGKKASGKTRLLDLLNILARNAQRADDMTTPVMFKLIERERPTLLVDESDTIWSGSRNEPKRRLINSGYKLGGSAWREQARELKEFSTFCPKVLAGIKNGFMPDTIVDRCISIGMEARGKDDELAPFNWYAVSKSMEVAILKDHIEMFVDTRFADVTAMRPELMSALSDRQNEICEPLLAIACVLGLEGELRAALQRVYSVSSGQKTALQIILEKLRTAFRAEPRLHTEDLCDCLGQGYNGRQLALFLQPFGIGPKDLRIDGVVRKGYEREQFDALFEEKLDPPIELKLVPMAEQPIKVEVA